MQINATTPTAPAAPPGMPGRGPGGPPAELAAALGVDVSELEGARRSGRSLAEFATSKGIAADTLLNAVKTTMAARRPQGAPAMSDAQLTAVAGDIISRAPGGPGGPPPAGGVQAPGAAPGTMPGPELLRLLRAAGGDPDGDADGDRSAASLLGALRATATPGATAIALDTVA